MDLEMSEEQRLIVETVRRFVEEQIVPLERELDPDVTELPREEHDRLVAMTKEMGFYNPDVPVELGGAGMDTVRACIEEADATGDGQPDPHDC